MKSHMISEEPNCGNVHTHGSYGNQFVKVVDVDVHKDTIHPGEDLLGSRQKMLGKWNSWNVTSGPFKCGECC